MRALMAIVAVAGVCALPSRADACGFMPYSESAEPRADALRHLLQDDALPLVDGSWRDVYLVLAWARVHGKRFSAAEVDALVAEPDLEQRCEGCAVQAAADAWLEARRPDAGRLGLPTSPAVDPYRSGGAYAHQLSCSQYMFAAATETLRARRASYSDAELTAWIRAQDQVFLSCQNPSVGPPPEIPGATLAAHDRAYQRAMALSLAGPTTDAEAAFEAIGRSASPWRDIGVYRAAYTRFTRGDRDPADLERRLGRVTDPTARRALTQLLDRARYAHEDEASAVTRLSQRLLREDLGQDVVRVIRDLAFHATDGDGPCTALGQVLAASRAATAPAACPGTTAVEPLAALIQDPAAWSPGSSPPPALALDAALARARAHASRGRRTAALRELRSVAPTVHRSSRATVNAFRATELALTSRAHLRVLLRYQDGDAVALHADGRAALRGWASADWRALAARRATPRRVRAQLETAGLLRSAALGRWAEARRFAEAVRADRAAHDGLRRGLPAVLAEPDGGGFELSLLLLLARLDADDWSIREELGSHHGSEQVSGCARRHCEARGPEHTPFSLAGVPARARRPDPERARLVRDGGRLSAFGRRALELARSHPTDPRAAELLHRFVELTRRASVHHVADPSMGAVSREAFERLHRDHPRSRWTAQTRHWYR